MNSLKVSIVKLILSLLLIIIPIYGLSNDNIVIGIFTQQYMYNDHHANPSQNSIPYKLTYILPTYLQLTHMSGAQAIPIYSYSNQSYISEQLKKVNGIIFPGGEQVIDMNNTWTQNAMFILKYAQKQNQQGRIFPILGICQGFQLMTYLTSNHRKEFLDHIQAQQGVYNNINFVQNNQQYYLLNGLSQQTYNKLTIQQQTKQGGITFFFHAWGVLLQTFNNDPQLSSYWNLYATTTSKSSLQQTFVSYLQSKQYPFYIIMFHPQRLAYSRQLSPQLIKGRIQLLNTISVNFIMKARQSVNYYNKSQLYNDLLDNVNMYDSNRFPNNKAYLINQNYQNIQPYQYIPIPEQIQQSPGFLILLIIGAVIFIVFSVYNTYKKKKQQTAQTLTTTRNNNQIQLNEDFS